MESGELTAKAAVSGVMSMPEMVVRPDTRWAAWFRRKYGWSLLSRGMENAAWLPYNHPDMENTRQKISALITEKKVHPGMMLNVDQVWRRAYDNKARFMYKDRSKFGKRAKRCRPARTIDKKAHYIGNSRRSLTVTWIHTV